MTDQDDVFEKLIASLEDVDEVWTTGTYTLNNKKLGISVYTSTQRDHFSLWEPAAMKFSKAKAELLASAVDVACSNVLARVFKKAEDAPEPGSVMYAALANTPIPEAGFVAGSKRPKRQSWLQWMAALAGGGR